MRSSWSRTLFHRTIHDSEIIICRNSLSSSLSVRHLTLPYSLSSHPQDHTPPSAASLECCARAPAALTHDSTLLLHTLTQTPHKEKCIVKNVDQICLFAHFCFFVFYIYSNIGDWWSPDWTPERHSGSL